MGLKRISATLLLVVLSFGLPPPAYAESSGWRLELTSVEYGSPEPESISEVDDRGNRVGFSFAASTGGNRLAIEINASDDDASNGGRNAFSDTVKVSLSVSPPPQTLYPGDSFQLMMNASYEMIQRTSYCGLDTYFYTDNVWFAVVSDNDLESSSGYFRLKLSSDSAHSRMRGEYHCGFSIERNSVDRQFSVFVIMPEAVVSQLGPEHEGDTCSLEVLLPGIYDENVYVRYTYTLRGGGNLGDGYSNSGLPFSDEPYQPFGIDPYQYDGGGGFDVKTIAIAGAAGLGVTVIVIKLVPKKSAVPKAEPAGIAGPEVYDWRGNRIDEIARNRQIELEGIRENRRVQQAHEERVRAERAAQRAHEQQQDRLFDELLHIRERLRTNSREVNFRLYDVTQRQYDAALSGKDLDPEKIQRIKRGFEGICTGRVLGRDDIPPMPTFIQSVKDAARDSFEEVCRNETALAVAARTAIAYTTGGFSEVVFQSGKGYYRMRDYIYEGGDSATGAFVHASYGAVRDYSVSKTSGRIMGTTPRLWAKGGFLGEMYNAQAKRLIKQGIDAADKRLLDAKGRAERQIRNYFE